MQHTFGQDAPGYDVIRPLFDESVAVAVTDPRASHHRVLPQEHASFSRIAAGQQRSFAAGRVAAHRAMARLGTSVRPVPVGANRAPIWPDGLVGSLASSHTCCVAALAHDSANQALGISVSEDTPLAPDWIALVCTLAERAWLSTCPPDKRGTYARLILQAKECAFDCQDGLPASMFDTDMFEVTPDLDTGQFEATFTTDSAPFQAGERLSGRFTMGNGLIVAAMSLRTKSARSTH